MGMPLPRGWAYKPLGAIVIRSRDKIEPGTEPDSLFRCVGLEHIESHTGRLLDVPQVRGSDLGSSKYSFRAGSVLYGRLRPYLNKVYRATFDGICSTEIWPLLPVDESINIDYVYHYLRCPEIVDYLSEGVEGANLPRVPEDRFANLTIPISGNRREQDRVVSILDQADGLRAKRRAADTRATDLMCPSPSALIHAQKGA